MCVCFTSCRVMFVHTHYKVADCPRGVVVSLSQRHLHFCIVLSLPTQQFLSTISMHVTGTMGFVQRWPNDEPGRANAP